MFVTINDDYLASLADDGKSVYVYSAECLTTYTCYSKKGTLAQRKHYSLHIKNSDDQRI
jgi:hypothetical protein